MAKVTKTFKASISLNPEKGGGWLANVTVSSTDDEGTPSYSSWKNASAAKRWIKAKVQELTPRKSVKLNVVKLDANEKPTAFSGELQYKE